MRSKALIFSCIVSICFIVVSAVLVKQIRYNQPTTIHYGTLSKEVQRQVDCLAQNIMFEAGQESEEGQVAVAMVTLNRVASGNYPDSVCGVVKHKIGKVCQFSWVCEDKKRDKRLTLLESSLYNDIRNLAVRVIFNYDKIDDVTDGATFYHADYVNPKWGLPKTKQIGRHIFYKRDMDLNNMKKEIKL